MFAMSLVPISPIPDRIALSGMLVARAFFLFSSCVGKEYYRQTLEILVDVLTQQQHRAGGESF